MVNKLISLTLILSFAMTAAAQNTDADKAEAEAKLNKNTVELLRETASDVASMRSPENRISFGAELASLMWLQDPKEGRALYLAAVNDFRSLVTQYDSEINAPSMPDDDAGVGIGMFLGGVGRSPAERKLTIAMAVRQQIALSLAEHDPDLAYSFYFDSIALISNPEKRKEFENGDTMFVLQLIDQIAQTNAEKAVKFGTESIKDGVTFQHIDLLRKLYARDPDKGIEFGAAVLSKLKSQQSDPAKTYTFAQLLSFGAANFEEAKKKPGQKSVYSEAELRDIADTLAQRILADDVTATYGSLELLAKYAPSRAAQISAKQPAGNMARPRSGSNTSANSMGRMDEGDNANVMRRSPTPDPALAAKEAENRKAIDDVKSLSDRSLPVEERQKIVDQARKVIASTPGKDKKIVALSLLAAQVAKAGDKVLAAALMKDAEQMVNPNPKNYQDFMLSWMLASGYSEVDTNKAFPILEDTIHKANETISAFVKVAEFIDVNEELISDGEVQVGLFGGSMLRGMTGELDIANSTVGTLTRADFAKMRNLTNSFDRVETRVLAKMLVLRAILDKKEAKTGSDVVLGVESRVVTRAPGNRR